MSLSANCVLLILCLGVCAVSARANDTIRVQELNEVVVTGDREWISNGTINVVPTKQEKGLSNSPASLIKAMHLPFVKEKDGAVVSLSGEPVQFFINGEKLDDIDLATFWPKDVRLVQYMENPAEPSFEGAKIAINFKMSVYEVGGVSKLNLFQRFPNNGYYTASSKLSYKKMTYGALISANYSRDHRTSMKGETKYSDIFYGGNFYDQIVRTEEGTSYSRDEAVNVAVNAKYSTDKMRITNTLSLGWSRNPGSGSKSMDSWSENLFAMNKSQSYNDSKNVSPQFRGDYFFRFSNRWFLATGVDYSFARNDLYTSAEFGDTKPVDNFITEDVNSLRVAMLPSFRVSDKWLFQFHCNALASWFSSRYSGSTNAKQNQSRQDLSTALKMYWSPIPTLSLSLEPGIVASFWQIGEVNQHMINPTMNTSLSWSPTSKYSISGSLRFYMKPPSATESNPVLVRFSELQWLWGNPYLKGLKSWDSYVYSTYQPNQWLALSFGVGYVKTFDELITAYKPAPIEYGGLIQEMRNARVSDRVRANFEIRGSFFGDNLSVGLSPQWHYVDTGGYNRHFNYLNLSGSADYTIGNCRFELWYDAPYKDLCSEGMESSWKQGGWNAAVIYGNNNLYLEFRGENIFNNKGASWIKYTSPNYSTNYNYLETGRAVTVKVTYTFGYGKRIDKTIDISGPESVSTSVYKVNK